jgi:hypothetical protein
VAVAINGKCAYVADGDSGLLVISIADSAHPAQVGRYRTLDFAYSVVVGSDSAYVADGQSGLRVMSVADSTQPVEVGYYDTPGFAYGVALSRSHVLVADFDAGLQVYQSYVSGIQETPSAASRIANPLPTVVRGALNLEVDGRQHSAYRAELLDISGRKVMDLKPGPNSVRALAPGVYFVREAQAQAQAQAIRKVVVTR